MITLGERIKELRKNRGLTQEKLAELISVNRDALAKWETDRAIPDINILKDLADLFKVTIDYLLARDDNSFEAKVMTILQQTKGSKSKEDEEFLLKMIKNYMETKKQ